MFGAAASSQIADDASYPMDPTVSNSAAGFDWEVEEARALDLVFVSISFCLLLTPSPGRLRSKRALTESFASVSFSFLGSKIMDATGSMGS